MEMYEYLPIPSDRMGLLWTLSSIEDAYIIEYGTAGTTLFGTQLLRGLSQGASVFTTGLEESDITFGSHEKLENAIDEVDKVYGPKYIFVMASSVTSVIGIDIESISYMFQEKTRAKLIPIVTGGFKGDYALGVREGIKLLCSEVVQETEETISGTYNIIGSQVDCYNFEEDVKEIKSMMEESFGYTCHTVFTTDTTIEDIENASQASFNLVIRSEGVDGALILEQKFGQPWVQGMPYGLKNTTDWINKIGKVTGMDPDAAYLKEMEDKYSKVIKSIGSRVKDLEGVTLAGNYDLVVGMMEQFEELGVNKVQGIINHKLKGESYFYSGKNIKEFISVCPSEDEKKEIVKDTEEHIVFGDGSLLNMFDHAGKFQVSNPSIGRGSRDKKMPFVGFGGIDFPIYTIGMSHH